MIGPGTFVESLNQYVASRGIVPGWSLAYIATASSTAQRDEPEHRFEAARQRGGNLPRQTPPAGEFTGNPTSQVLAQRIALACPSPVASSRD
jgi:hypothetical protein